jgi:SAM-dependent methyltransferase
MSPLDLMNRVPPVPFGEGSKIPWHEPGFSARMLREHLSQHHDRASRRFGVVDRHVAWLHESILGGRAGRIVDLGCGPGLYTARLARLGHTCLGIDFSPAAIAHAQAEARGDGLACEYRLEDLRTADQGSGHDLVLLSFGELNTFAPKDAREILTAAHGALVPGGALVLEVHEEAFVRELGAADATWYTAEKSVFSDEPHLCLRECAWHPGARAATEQFFVMTLPDGSVEGFVSTTQAFSEGEYSDMLRGAGFTDFRRCASLTGDTSEAEEGLFVLTAHA